MTAVSAAALAIAVVLGSSAGDGFRRFSFAYLTAFAVVLAMIVTYFPSAEAV